MNKTMPVGYWISVEEKLPFENQAVLVWGGTAVYRGGEWFTGMDSPQYSKRIVWPVTHWAVLPLKPEEPIPFNPSSADWEELKRRTIALLSQFADEMSAFCCGGTAALRNAIGVIEEIERRNHDRQNRRGAD